MDMDDENGNTFALHTAVLEDDVETVKLLLDGKVEVNQPDNDGKTPLTLAAELGNVLILQVLYDAGGCVNAIDRNVSSPLLQAISGGHYDCVKFLIEKKADIQAARDNWTPLHCAAQTGAKEIIQLLIDSNDKLILNPKSNIGDTPLHWAAKLQDPGCAEILLKHAKNKKEFVNEKNSEGKLPLHFAAYQGSVEVIELLLNNSAEINGQDNMGQTALHFVAQLKGDESGVGKVKKLIERGADREIKNNNGFAPYQQADGDVKISNLLKTDNQLRTDSDNIPDKNGNTRLHIEAKNNDESLFLRLLPPRDFNKQNEKGQTVLFICAKYGRNQNIKALLNVAVASKREINKDLHDKSGNTPLLEAAARGHKDTVVLLLNSKVNLYATNKFGMSALHRAANRGHVDIMKSLIDAAKEFSTTSQRKFQQQRDGNGSTVLDFVRQKDKNGYSAIHHIVKYNNKEGIMLLLHYGSDVNDTNCINITPLHLASRFRCKDNIKVLLEEGADANRCDYLNRTPVHWGYQPGCDLSIINLFREEENIKFKGHENISDIFNYVPHNFPVSSIPFL